jgi:hypothetical protein
MSRETIWIRFPAMLGVAATLFVAAGCAADGTPSVVTLPFTLDHNRMIVEVEFVRPDASVRKASAWVDTGEQHLMLAETLARDLGLDLSAWNARQQTEEPILPAPLVRLAGMPLDVEGIRTRVGPGALAIAGVPAEAHLPASAFRRCHVVFDYPAHHLTVARAGALRPRGTPIPCRVNAETGLFMVAATVDGEIVHLGVDNGSAGTWVSDALVTAWATRHPDWARSTGAVGSTNFFGFPFEARGSLMRLPELGLGALRVRNIGLLGLDQRLFEWYSKKSAAPVVGFLGANVLKGFRLEVDFRNQMTFWEAGPPPVPEDLDIVGLTLRPEPDGSFVVAGVASKGGTRTVDGVLSGDKLIRVDGLDTGNATMGAVIDALRGEPGATRALLVEREGQRFTVSAQVVRHP